jgi:hypothetical protein
MHKKIEEQQKTIKRHFSDIAAFSPTERTAVTVRDGVLEYLGVELGLEPADKVFTVYRSPATIANAAYCMQGIPITDEHVSLDGDRPDTGSTVTTSEVIDQIDEPTHSRLAVRNKLSVSDAMSVTLQDKRQLSLGYGADLIPHSKWDFEQVGIVPHHLAVVPAGRCGPLCSFLDRKPESIIQPQEEKEMSKFHKAFLDADGAISLEQIVEMATGMSEAIRKVPVSELPRITEPLLEIMSYAKEQGALPEEATAEESTGEEEETMEDEETSEEEKPKFTDADFRKKLDTEKSKFADAEVKRYAEVVNKARNFVDAEYDFVGKTANRVMRDSLATQSTDKFEDAELSVAFKLLRKPDTDYSKFGDSHPDGGLTARIKAEMGEK